MPLRRRERRPCWDDAFSHLAKVRQKAHSVAEMMHCDRLLKRQHNVPSGGPFEAARISKRLSAGHHRLRRRVWIVCVRGTWTQERRLARMARTRSLKVNLWCGGRASD